LENEKKQQNYLTGAATLAASTLIVKVIGMFFKIPLQRLIGDNGYGYFTTAYDIYTVLLMIATTGLPVAMSRMVSEAKTLGNGRQIKRIYHASLIVFLTIGVVGTGGMLLFSKQLASVMGQAHATYSIFALGPAVFFVCFISSCRGWFQGQSNMVPTAVSQVVEALCKLFLGMGLAWLVMRETGRAELAAAASIAGVTVGTVLSALYLSFKRRRTAKTPALQQGEALPMGVTMKTLLAIALPITLGAAGLQMINVVDSGMVMWRLKGAAGYTQEMADELKGIYNYCQTIFNFPCAFIPNITVAIIPVITGHLTLKNARGVRMAQESSLRLMGLIAMPCAVGLMVLSRPILTLLSDNRGEELAIAAQLLSVLGFAVVFNSIVLMTDAFMQAQGHVVIPVINTIIGGVVKVIVNYILVGNPDIGIIGAPIGTILCYITITVLNILAMRRVLPQSPKMLSSVWRSGLAALIMGAGTYGAYFGLSAVLSSTVLCLGGALVVAVGIYAICILKCKAITYDDCLLLPKGEKIAKILKIG
jgi:stage V sporulation protein B